MAVNPVFTYLGGIAFLVLIIGTMLYLTFSTRNVEDDNPGESVIQGIDADGEPIEDEALGAGEDAGASGDAGEGGEVEAEEGETESEENEAESEEGENEADGDDAEEGQADGAGSA